MVTILPYNSTWPGEFRSIAAQLRHALSELALRIDHIGSTSVPGLDAKDRIDIQVTVAGLDPPVENALTHIGYTRLEILADHPPFGLDSQADQWAKWYFKPPEGQRPTNLQVRIDGHANQRYLADIDAYPDVKDAAVDLIYFAAQDWAAATTWHPGPSDA